jgi:Rieske Fe-S protein
MPNFKSAEELETIAPGEGKVLSMLEEEFAIYRDPQGEFHALSAYCTHLKCKVAWNQNEKSWDCPCHGSRFTIEVIVINGPANTDLERFDALDHTSLDT